MNLNWSNISPDAFGFTTTTDKEEGEMDKMLFSGYNQLLDGKNDIIVAIYDANMETDIAIAVITIITRRIVGCISLVYTSGYPDFII